MTQMIWLRASGVGLAVLLLAHAGFGFYAEISLPQPHARDLFGPRQPAATQTAVPTLIRRLSLNGDVLADDAIVKTRQVLDQPASDATARATDNQAAQHSLEAALKVSPIRPMLWLALATLKAEAGNPPLPALRMSYLTGSVVPDVAFSRLQAVTSTSAATDEDIRLLATSDIRAVLSNRARFEAPLIAAYVQATPDGKKLLLESTQNLDPKFNELLRRY